MRIPFLIFTFLTLMPLASFTKAAQIVIDKANPINPEVLIGNFTGEVEQNKIDKFRKRLNDNLEVSSLFNAYMTLPNDNSAVKNNKNKYIITGNISKYKQGYKVQYKINVDGSNISAGRTIGAPRLSDGYDIEFIADKISNQILEAIVGIKGIFDTKIAYIQKPQNKKSWSIKVADFTLAGKKNIYTLYNSSSNIIVSPEWHPKAELLTYVSFNISRNKKLKADDRAPVIYGIKVYKDKYNNKNYPIVILNNKIFKSLVLKDPFLSKLKNINFNNVNLGSPRWSSDGTKLLFSAGDGYNYKIYCLELDISNNDQIIYKGLYLISDINNTFDANPTWIDKDNIAFTHENNANGPLTINRSLQIINLNDKKSDPYAKSKVIPIESSNKEEIVAITSPRIANIERFVSTFNSNADSKKYLIFIGMNKNGKQSIYRLQLDQELNPLGPAIALYKGDYTPDSPSVSSNGLYAMYTAKRVLKGIARQYIMLANTEGRKMQYSVFPLEIYLKEILDDFTGEISYLAWSPARSDKS